MSYLNDKHASLLDELFRPNTPQQELERQKRLADAALERAAELQAKLDAMPDEPERGSVVRFKRKFTEGGKIYSYAAVRVGNLWYLTASRNASGPEYAKRWHDLVDFANVGKIAVASKWRKI